MRGTYNTKWRKQTRKDAADSRQSQRDSRSDATQLALLDSRPGQSAKERARLT